MKTFSFVNVSQFVTGGKSKYYIELSLHARTETAEESFIGKTEIFIERSVDKCSKCVVCLYIIIWIVYGVNPINNTKTV